ncbi:MAG: siderophore-interacting protein [Deltaproteobacteria bacterium]|jgi:NADPH-dependent ferric siderophore reductase
MSQDRASFRLVRHPLIVRRLTVVRTQRLHSRFARVTLGGPALDGFVTLAPEDHVKLFFPVPGEREPVLPRVGASGFLEPPPSGTPISRDYTPRRFDDGELDIDFFLHGEGVASRWAASAKVGAPLGLAGPRGSFVLQRDFDWHLFIGDETALPEMARRIESLGDAKVLAIFYVAEPRIYPVPDRDDLDLEWVTCAEELRTRVRSVALPAGDGFIWIAGEAHDVRSTYRHFVADRGIPPSRVHASGHWKRGVVDHDHHEPISAEVA